MNFGAVPTAAGCEPPANARRYLLWGGEMASSIKNLSCESEDLSSTHSIPVFKAGVVADTYKPTCGEVGTGVPEWAGHQETLFQKHDFFTQWNGS